MWTLIASDGRLLTKLGSEETARGTVHSLGSTLVDSHAVRYRVYWRDGGGTLCRHVRGELAIPRIEYWRQWT